MKVLYFGNSGTVVDAYWHLLVEFNPDEMLNLRVKQKAYLARYGRQDWFAWDNREVHELDEASRAIGEIVRAENEANETGRVQHET